MLFNYKEAFSLRDEIGTCPNIEMEIDVTDKFTTFYKTISHGREEDKDFIDKENEAIVLHGNIEKRDF